MTFIHPKKETNILNKVLLLLTAMLVLGAFWIVILYNNFVNLNHGLSNLKKEFESVQIANAEQKDKIFSLLNSTQNNLKTSELIQDKNPAYLEVEPKWSYASGY